MSIENYAKFYADSPVVVKQMDLIIEEMNKALIKHPRWPAGPVERASIVMEEAGEVIREANHILEGHGDPALLEKELIHTAGTIFRMLLLMEGEK